MPYKSEAPAGKAGATREKLAGGSRFPLTLDAYRVQTLVLAHHVRPEMAGMLAALAFGGAA